MRSPPSPRRVAIAAGVALLASACAAPPPAEPQTTTFQAEGDYRHVVTGLAFPPAQVVLRTLWPWLQ